MTGRVHLVIAAAAVIICAVARPTLPAWADSHQPPPPKNKDVTISNGGLSITFNLAWGAVVIGISNRNVAHGLNLVDFHDVGRELQVDQFLYRNSRGPQPLLVNPTQAGAEGYQAYYLHPHGSIFPEKGSPVVKWMAGRHRFFAVIRPWDYDTGHPTHWVYTERVHIDPAGVAHFYYRFQRHGPGTFRMNTEIPTLYSDRTNAFMYPMDNSYVHRTKPVGKIRPHQTVRIVRGAPIWGRHHLMSDGWIANIDTADRIGIFYTTPVGLPETFGCFPGAGVSDRLPLGKTNVVGTNLLCRPNEFYSVRFSVLVATPKAGPKLIARQKPAELRIDGKSWSRAKQ
jgi:hypothetical protein